MDHLKKLTDENLVDHVRKNNKEAYIEVVSRYQEKLLRYARYLASDPSKASDIVQNAFIKAYINLNSFNVNRKFSTWIYRIVHNEAMRELGRRDEIPIPEGIDFPSGKDLESELIAKEISAMVTDCLNGLPLPYREPLSLHFLEKKSYEEISDILRMPVGTVGTRINRAKILMKKLCQMKSRRTSLKI